MSGETEAIKQNRLQEILNSREGRVVTLGAVSTIALILLVVLGIFPAVNSILAQIEQNQEREVALIQIDDSIDTLVTLSQEVQEKEDLANVLRNVMPRGFSQELVLERVFALGESAEVEFSNVRFFNTPVNRERILAEEFSSLPINSKQMSIQLRGTIAQIQSYINLLEDSRYIFNLQNVDLQRASQSIGLLYQSNIQLEIYYLDEIL